MLQDKTLCHSTLMRVFDCWGISHVSCGICDFVWAVSLAFLCVKQHKVSCVKVKCEMKEEAEKKCCFNCLQAATAYVFF